MYKQCFGLYHVNSWSQKNPDGKEELIQLFVEAGSREGLVGSKPIALLRGRTYLFLNNFATLFIECIYDLDAIQGASNNNGRTVGGGG